ncbi:hypothetical protein GOC32_29895, partial [Sinorhizobium meliloti]|nr:hypothetical protein [Sinorhizobium meliloti]
GKSRGAIHPLMESHPAAATFSPQAGRRDKRQAPAFRRSDLRAVEIRDTRRGLFDLLIPVLVTGIQPAQVLGLEELFPAPQTRRCCISVTSTENRP